jgi:HlyD family secretion protein
MRWASGIVLAAVVAVSACGDPPPSSAYPGYVEAEYVRVAAPLAGHLARLAVVRGDRVAPGQALFALESEAEQAARAEAEARVARAQATVANLEKARRPPEIAAVRAQLDQARAMQKAAESEFVRTERLVADRFLAPQRLDDVTAERDRARARVAELEAQLAVTRLPARADEIAAAKAEARAASDALAQAQWRLDQKTQTAPVAGLVTDTLYRAGEWVPAGMPVVALLPPSNVKLRFFVPEAVVATLRIGEAVEVRCDGCGEPIAARISFVAPEAEYTPPVIYSRENRAKLVFLVEARPQTPSEALRPGLPVEIARSVR